MSSYVPRAIYAKYPTMYEHRRPMMDDHDKNDVLYSWDN